MNIYDKFKLKQTKQVNDFPLLFAFGQAQFDAMLQDNNLTKKDLVSAGGGCYIRKTDVEAWNKLDKQWDKEFTELMKKDNFVLHMFLSELANHEYCYTYDLTDTLDACQLTREQVEKDIRLSSILETAKARYLRNIIC